MVVPVVGEDGRVYYQPAEPRYGYAPPYAPQPYAPQPYAPYGYQGSPPVYGSPPPDPGAASFHYGTPPQQFGTPPGAGAQYYAYAPPPPPLASSPPVYGGIPPAPGSPGGRQARSRRGGVRQRQRDAARAANEGYDDGPAFAPPQAGNAPLPIFSAAELRGRVTQLCRDQHGSRFLQAHLEDARAPSAERDLIFDEVLPHARDLATDVFGNYVVQKVLACGDAGARRAVFERIEGHAIELGTHVYGCRVVQKALEALAPDDAAALVAEFDGAVLQCVHDQNGNHVIQKCVEVTAKAARAARSGAAGPGNERLAALGDVVLVAFEGQCRALASHPFGCRVLQRILEHWGGALRGRGDELGRQRVAALLDELQRGDLRALVEDQYANYVMQHAIQFGRDADRARLVASVKRHLVDYSRHKFASNVVEKCLEFGAEPDRRALVAQVVGDASSPSHLKLLLVDPFANYVVQKVVDLADMTQVQTIAAALRPIASQVRHTPGKHILTRLEKKLPGLKF